MIFHSHILGQANRLETTCPICYHEPINAEDCRPNKALRQTIKIFLKKKAIDRDNAKKQESIQRAATTAPSVPSTSDTVEPPNLPVVNTVTTATRGSTEAVVKVEGLQRMPSETPVKQEAIPSGLQQESMKDIPQQSIEVCEPTNASQLYHADFGSVTWSTSHPQTSIDHHPR